MLNRSTDEFDDDDDSRPLQELRRLVGGVCTDCVRLLTPADALFSIALGFKSAPRCLTCLGQRLGREADELRTELLAYVHRRECFLKAWREVERLSAETPVPAAEPIQSPATTSPLPAAESAAVDDPTERPVWNAGDLGCGELVMELRLRLAKMPPGAELEVLATDPAAPEDIPSWCRLTGHPLVAAQHPRYLIRRKENTPCPASLPSA